MADHARRGQEPMYCHACHHQWPRDGEKMECPECMSASTEIVRSPSALHDCAGARADNVLAVASDRQQIHLDHDPRHFHNRQETASTPGAPHPTSGQGITPEDTSPDSAIPSQSSNNETQNSTQNSTENSAESATGTADTTSGNASTSHTADQPLPRMIFFFVPQVTFATFTPTTDMPSPPEGESPPPSSGSPDSESTSPGFFLPTSRWHFTFSPTPATPPIPPADSTNPNNPHPAATEPSPENQQQNPSPPPPPPNPLSPTTDNDPHPALPALLTMITALGPLSTFLNQHHHHHHNGDAVFSDAALDAIIARLREQTPIGGPPPASREAVEALRVRRVGCCHDEGVCGGDCVMSEGNREGERGKCVVCVEEFGRGEEVAVLPCEHFFHGECVRTWLGLHGTCPVCRASVEVSRDGEKGVGKEGVDGDGDGDGGVVGRGEREMEMDAETETETEMPEAEGEEGGRGDRGIGAMRNLFNGSGRRARMARARASFGPSSGPGFGPYHRWGA